MALAATPADIKSLENLTGCAFACHDLSETKDRLQIATEAKIQLRIDAAREALAALIPTMESKSTQNDQYRVSGYHFGDKIESRVATQFIRQTTNLDQAATDALSLHLMSMPFPGYNNQMASDFASTLSQMTTLIGQSGDGTSVGRRQKMLLIITDGMNTTLRPADCPIALNAYGQCQSPIDPKWCATMKANGVKIGILYTTYYPVPSDSWYNTYIKPVQPSLGTRLAQCASPNMFSEVQPHQGITQALQDLFFSKMPNPRLAS